MVIYRVVSLGHQLDFLPFSSTFFSHSSLSSNSNPKNDWLSIGGLILFGISLLEVLFSLYCLYLIRCVQAEPQHQQRPFETLRNLILRALGSGLEPDHSSFQNPSTHQHSTKSQSPRIPSSNSLVPTLPYDHPKAKDFRENHLIWFQNCRWQDIYRDNHLEWLCCVLLNKTLEEVKEEDKLRSKEDVMLPRLEELVVAYENRVGIKIPDGYNELLRNKIIRLTKDPVRVIMRPLTLSYGFAWLSNEIIRQTMKCRGFKLKKCLNRKHGSKYFVRIPESWKKLPREERPTPVVFLHGVGMGFLLYVTLINHLVFSTWAKERPVMILVQPHISMEIFSPGYLRPPSQTQLTDDIRQAFEEQGFDQTGIEIVAHSNGTAVAGWIMKAFPQLVKRSCLLDPICFALWEGHVCYNFLYSKPRTGLEKLLRFGMSRELGIASYTQRHFNWADAVLWPDQIPGFLDPDRFKVFLSEKDGIVNAPRIRRYLLDEGMREASLGSPSSEEMALLDVSDRLEASQESLCEVGTNRHDSILDGRNSGGRLKGVNNRQVARGGLVFIPDCAHGQALVPGHPYFKVILRALEGQDIEVTHD